jgi:cation transport ATPase
VNNSEPKQSPEQNIVEQKVRHAAGINALRKIVAIVAREQQADTDTAKVLRWFARYGWIVLLGAALLVAYAIGFIEKGVI